jgi:hypothetical protein
MQEFTDRTQSPIDLKFCAVYQNCRGSMGKIFEPVTITPSKIHGL